MKPIGDGVNLVEALVGAEVMVPQEDGKAQGICKVLRAAVDENGKYIGSPSEHAAFNTMVMQCMCWDGQVREYAANVIAENILNRCDKNGHYACELKTILDHRRDESAYDFGQNIKQKHLKTTKGWQFLCRFKDGSCQWIKLSELKESYPVDVAIYARAQGLDAKPAFKWWVPHTLKKMKSIVKSVKASMAKKNMKYGVCVPRMYAQAREFNAAKKN